MRASRTVRSATPDGTVLVLDVPQLATQVIDVRDLAAWLVDAGQRNIGGIFNVTGQTIQFSGHLQVARTVAGHTGALARADEQWLLAQGVQSWMGERSLPLWLSDPQWRGMSAHSSRKARATGLCTRPLEQTLADTLAWELTRGTDRIRRAGLSDDDERTLLRALAQG